MAGAMDRGKRTVLILLRIKTSCCMACVCLEVRTTTSLYTVTLTIKGKQTGTKEILASKTGIFPSKQLQYSSGNYYGFEILFDFKAECMKKAVYEIEAVISGRSSWQGNGGTSSVVCTSVTFTFTTTRIVLLVAVMELVLELDNFLKYCFLCCPSPE